MHLSFGTGSYFVLLRDEVNGQLQGAVVPMPGQFLSGVHRWQVLASRWPVVCIGLWLVGAATRRSVDVSSACVYTGQPVQVPTGFHVHENGEWW